MSLTTYKTTGLPPKFNKPLEVRDSCFEPCPSGLPKPISLINLHKKNPQFSAVFLGIDLFPMGNDYTVLERKLLYRHLAAILRSTLCEGDPHTLLDVFLGSELEWGYDQLTKEDVVWIGAKIKLTHKADVAFKDLKLEFRFSQGVAAPKSVTVHQDICQDTWSLRPVETHPLYSSKILVPQDAVHCCVIKVEGGECPIEYSASQESLYFLARKYFKKDTLKKFNSFVKFAVLRLVESILHQSDLSNYLGDGVVWIDGDVTTTELKIHIRIKTADYKGKVGYVDMGCNYSFSTVVGETYMIPDNPYLDGFKSVKGICLDDEKVTYDKIAIGDIHTPNPPVESLADAFKAAADSADTMCKSMVHPIVDEAIQGGAPPPINFSKDQDGEMTASYFEGSKTMKQPNTQSGLKAGMSLADAVAHAQQAKAKTQGSKEAKLMSNPTATGLAGFFKTRVKVHFGKTVTVNAKGFGQLKQLITRVGKKRVYRAMECVLNNWDDFLLYVKQERNWTPDCTLPNIGILLHLADEMQEFYAMTTGDKDVDEGKTAYQTEEEVKQSNDNTIDDIWG